MPLCGISGADRFFSSNLATPIGCFRAPAMYLIAWPSIHLPLLSSSQTVNSGSATPSRHTPCICQPAIRRLDVSGDLHRPASCLANAASPTQSAGVSLIPDFKRNSAGIDRGVHRFGGPQPSIRKRFDDTPPFCSAHSSAAPQTCENGERNGSCTKKKQQAQPCWPSQAAAQDLQKNRCGSVGTVCLESRSGLPTGFV